MWIGAGLISELFRWTLVSKRIFASNSTEIRDSIAFSAASGVRRMRQHFMQLIGTHFKYLNWRVISCLRPPFNRRRSIGNVIRATRDRHRIKELEQVATDRVQCEINRGREFVKITPRSSIHYILTYVQSFTGRPKTFAA